MHCKQKLHTRIELELKKLGKYEFIYFDGWTQLVFHIQ